LIEIHFLLQIIMKAALKACRANSVSGVFPPLNAF
jgi:hypothetical protein